MSPSIRSLLGLLLLTLITSARTHADLVKIGNDPNLDGIALVGLELQTPADGEFWHNAFPSEFNPLIDGKNLYAPDVRKYGSNWIMYYGGFKNTTDTRDEIYYSTTSSSDPSSPWSSGTKLISTQTQSPGAFQHANDPSVINIAYGSTVVYYMYYTATKWGAYHDIGGIYYSASLSATGSFSPNTPDDGYEIEFTSASIADVFPGDDIYSAARPSV